MLNANLPVPREIAQMTAALIHPRLCDGIIRIAPGDTPPNRYPNCDIIHRSRTFNTVENNVTYSCSDLFSFKVTVRHAKTAEAFRLCDELILKIAGTLHGIRLGETRLLSRQQTVHPSAPDTASITLEITALTLS